MQAVAGMVHAKQSSLRFNNFDVGVGLRSLLRFLLVAVSRITNHPRIKATTMRARMSPTPNRHLRPKTSIPLH